MPSLVNSKQIDSKNANEIDNILDFDTSGLTSSEIEQEIHKRSDKLIADIPGVIYLVKTNASNNLMFSISNLQVDNTTVNNVTKSSSTYTIEHNLNNLIVLVQVRRADTGEEYQIYNRVVDENNIEIHFNVDPFNLGVNYNVIISG